MTAIEMTPLTTHQKPSGPRRPVPDVLPEAPPFALIVVNAHNPKFTLLAIFSVQLASLRIFGSGQDMAQLLRTLAAKSEGLEFKFRHITEEEN